MTKFGTILGAGLAVSVLLIALPGCQKQEGPMEVAGKKVDDAMEKTGQKIEQVGENIQDTAKGNNTDSGKY
ncbi:MAG: hypothetical protein PHD37_09640 [Gallionellaceae bacterium]|nr:hypothetical protein [Gallionellaceae bacterium]